MENKKIVLGGLLLGVLLISFLIIFKKNKMVNYQESNLNIVLSLEDKISKNSVWCGTFNLIWNDLKNELVKKDIVFEPQLNIVENLNKETFNTNYLSDSGYYKKLGVIKPELKTEIEKGIKDKFNETSDILDNFDFTYTSDNNYFLYAMLKKDFKFPYVFTDLGKSDFKNITNVKYFGINAKTDYKVRSQVQVLYYENKETFAVKLKTKEGEEVILSRGFKGETFKDIYDNINDKSKKYTGSKTLSDADTLKIPEIHFNLKEEFRDLENKNFYLANGEEYFISKAIQTIQFELCKDGGKIKSEAGMEINKTAIDNQRSFSFTDDFVIMLKESNKDLPYFAAFTSDIKSVQK